MIEAPGAYGLHIPMKLHHVYDMLRIALEVGARLARRAHPQCVWRVGQVKEASRLSLMVRSSDHPHATKVGELLHGG